MAEFENWKFDPATFSGKVCLFPLPNLVVFPHVMQPLHVFEPRYQKMLQHVMAGDRLIAMSVLRPGWEKQYEGRPPVEPIACLTRVVTCQSVGEGRSNILVLGLKRIELIRELPPDFDFRVAEARVLEDDYSTDGTTRSDLHQRLLTEFKKAVPAQTSSCEQIDQLLSGDISLGMLTDIVSYALGLDMKRKAELLAECAVDHRAQTLLDHLASLPKGTQKPSFPPEFSTN
jgi:Lon protease-like protein